MEFAAVGLVLRVVPLAVKGGKSLYNYYGNVAEAPAQVLRLRQELGTVIAILNTLKDTLENSPTGFKGTETVLEVGLVQCCLAQHEKCLWRIKTPPTCRHRSYRPGAVGSQILGRLYICTADARCMRKTVCSECAIQMTYKCHETDLVVIPSIECQEKLQLTCVDISQEDHVHCSGSYRGIYLGE